MLLALKVMLLEIEVMLLHAEVMLLQKVVLDHKNGVQNAKRTHRKKYNKC